jgi:hypothetical protein
MQTTTRSTTRTAGARRTRSRRTLVAALVASALLGAACTAERNPFAHATLPAADWVASLRPAAGCSDLVQAAAPVLRATVDSWWPEHDGPGWFSGGGEDSADEQSGAVAADGAPPSGPASTTAPPPELPTARSGDEGSAPASDTPAAPSVVVGTNNQEVAVDEADLVKTDGRRLVSIVNGVLRVVTLDDTPSIDGSLDLGGRGATEMFLRGDTALVLGTTYGAAGAGSFDAVPRPGVPVAPAPFPVATTLTMVSLQDPAAPTVTATAEVEGTLVTARDAAGRARIVVQGTPAASEQLGTDGGRAAALGRIDSLDDGDLLPRVSRGGTVRSLGGCEDVWLAEPAPGTSAQDAAAVAVESSNWSGVPALGTVTVLTVGDDLADLAPVSVQGGASTVYASPSALYVAGAAWDQAGSRTDVHRFALPIDGPATYTGSGRAPGHLLNQFSLSERDGALRLVTTLDGDASVGPVEPGMGGVASDGPMVDLAPAGTSSARLTVLDTDGALDEIGHLDGMGIGERVQSVRFMDDLAYVVTFRQVDPLYALDLSEPTAPRLLGELKIPGFSQYLHPVGDGLLLGVGRQVDPETGIDEGLKISLFDVSDPLAMTETDQIVLPDASSEVSRDHRAFLWDPTRGRAVVPVELGCDPTGPCEQAPGGAALVIAAGRDGLGEVARFAHEPLAGWSLQPNRTVLVDDDLWSVSIAAIGRTDADAPSSAELLRF